MKKKKKIKFASSKQSEETFLKDRKVTAVSLHTFKFEKDSKDTLACTNCTLK